MEKKSQEELEKPAKVYQVDILYSEIADVKKLLVEQNTMLKNTVTSAYLEERLKNLAGTFEAKLELMKGEYKPVLGSAKWVARTAILAFISVAAGIILALLKG